ncbi:MAG: BON domain-containing protein [Gammaproteobacteria bacterium]|nr:BON domain-containing protein [Gammaproteobacteria bacterium]NNF60808.1 BON domain-containing protein [Gammaproteobacteria bacterium]NNM21727.1 BON domain-containing protein [Gammaproteobacteria bacterium]
MSRWLALVVISALVISGLSGCVLVVADEGVTHDFVVERGSNLARSIQRDIDNDAALAVSDIEISEDDGIVTLHGRAENLGAVQHAIDVAARYEEVSAVVSRLRVKVEL